MPERFNGAVLKTVVLFQAGPRVRILLPPPKGGEKDGREAAIASRSAFRAGSRDADVGARSLRPKHADMVASGRTAHEPGKTQPGTLAPPRPSRHDFVLEGHLFGSINKIERFTHKP